MKQKGYIDKAIRRYRRQIKSEIEVKFNVFRNVGYEIHKKQLRPN